jgi:hypothetical protein
MNSKPRTSTSQSQDKRRYKSNPIGPKVNISVPKKALGSCRLKVFLEK